MDLSIQVPAIVSYSICMRMRVRVFGERESGPGNERTRERTRERKRDGPSLLSGSIQLIQFNASSSLSMDLGAPATRRCGLARGGPPSAALAPATAGTRRASDAWQPRGNSPESLLEETNQASWTHHTCFQSGLHSLAPCCQERLFSKGHKDISLSLLSVCVCEREREREREGEQADEPRCQHSSPRSPPCIPRHHTPSHLPEAVMGTA